MRRPFAFLLPACLLSSACSRGDAAPSDGQLVMQRDGATLFTAPATIIYCDADSTLAAIGLGDTWYGAVAVRAAWPLSAAHDHAVTTERDSPGTARLALRARSDTAKAVWNADSGSVRLGAGRTVRLTWSVRAVTQPEDTMRLEGEVTGEARERCS